MTVKILSFSEEQEYLQRAIFRIFEVRTACINRNTSIHRNRSSVIPSLSAIQKDFMNFTKKR